MSWEYRVMNRDGELAIYEVYYGDDETVKGYSAEPAFNTWQRSKNLYLHTKRKFGCE
jgi:hypothetical protein